MIIQTKEKREILIEAGRRLGVVLYELGKQVSPGVHVKDLDALAEKLIRDGGDEPSFLGYTPDGSGRAYPASLCLSVNDEVVHGIPTESARILKEGDLVSLDLGLTHKGVVVDSAITVSAGRSDKTGYKLMDVTAGALELAMAAAVVGGHVGDISHATEKAFVGTGFSVVKVLGGHGVGDHVHEEPFIANSGRAGSGEKLVSGMVLALEPIANEGKASVVISDDGYTFRTKDGSRSAHFEHTILIDGDNPVVVTRRPDEV